MSSRVSLAILLLLVTTGCASTRRWSRLAVDDVRALGTAVREADAQDWRRAGVAVGAVAAAVALDDTAHELVQSSANPTTDNLAEKVEPFGGRYSDRVLAGFLLAGLVGRNDRMKSVAFDGFVSSMIASKGITPALKQITSRDRPSEGSSDDSFPSNHSTQAFAVASVIASHYDQRWVDITAYGLASLVGYARIYHDDHHFSDVVAGAIIGTTVGKLVVRTNERGRARWAVGMAGTRGVVVSVRF